MAVRQTLLLRVFASIFTYMVWVFFLIPFQKSLPSSWRIRQAKPKPHNYENTLAGVVIEAGLEPAMLEASLSIPFDTVRLPFRHSIIFFT